MTARLGGCAREISQAGHQRYGAGHETKLHVGRTDGRCHATFAGRGNGVSAATELHAREGHLFRARFFCLVAVPIGIALSRKMFLHVHTPGRR